MHACMCQVGLFANFRKMHGFFNKMLPMYVKIRFGDFIKPVNEVGAVESYRSEEHI